MGADIDDAGLAVRVLLETDDFGVRAQRLAGIDLLQEAPLGIAEIGDGVLRDVRDRLAEYGVEDEEVVERTFRQANRLRENVGRLQCKARTIKRGIERRVALGQRARRGMRDLLPEAEVLEEVSGVRFHQASCHPGRTKGPVRDPSLSRAGYRSSQWGLSSSIKRIFQSRRQRFSRFSFSMAKWMSP